MVMRIRADFSRRFWKCCPFPLPLNADILAWVTSMASLASVLIELGVSTEAAPGLLMQDSSIPGLFRFSNCDRCPLAEAEYHRRPLVALSPLSSLVLDGGSLVENRNFRESFLLLVGLENPYASSSEIANSFMSTISISSAPPSPRLSDSMRVFFDLSKLCRVLKRGILYVLLFYSHLKCMVADSCLVSVFLPTKRYSSRSEVFTFR